MKAPKIHSCNNTQPRGLLCGKRPATYFMAGYFPGEKCRPPRDMWLCEDCAVLFPTAKPVEGMTP